MGPVSFSRFPFPSRSDAMEAARILTGVGIRVQTIDGDTTLLVRSDDHAAASDALAGLLSDGAPSSIEIDMVTSPFDATITVPGSKSHTNRALIAAALASGRSTLTGALAADDTRVMLDSLARLGIPMTIDDDGPSSATVTVDGAGPTGIGVDRTTEVDVGQSGTTGRFLLPVLAASRGRFVLDGHSQLRARPFGPQIEALRRLGADLDGSRLPLVINGRTLAGGPVGVSGDVSSQFLSGLLLAAPLFGRPTEITVEADLVSQPYVRLTIETMATFGVDVGGDVTGGRFQVPNTGYRAADVTLEPDASAASYFFAAAALTGSRVRIEGLGRSSVQGDVRFVDLLAWMGADVDVGSDHIEVRGTGTLAGITADMGDISDTAQTLAVVAACAEGPTEVTGIGFIRHKETDRIAAPVTELRRLGIDAEATDDGFVIRPGPLTPATVNTYDDHRMAMSFALLGLVEPGIVIADPGCVNKTFPHYFDLLSSLDR